MTEPTTTPVSVPSDDLRKQVNELGELAKDLFEAQFARCDGGRMPADPTWDDLEPSERDDFWEQARNAAHVFGPRSVSVPGDRSKLRHQIHAALDTARNRGYRHPDEADTGDLVDAVMGPVDEWDDALHDDLKDEVAKLRALHHTPYVDAEHQGGNCVDVLMSQAAEIARRRQEADTSAERCARLGSERNRARAELATTREDLESLKRHEWFVGKAAESRTARTVAELTEFLVAASSEWDDNTGDDEGPTSRPYLEHLARAIESWRPVPAEAGGEPSELSDLPVEVRRLVHAVDRLRDGWNDSDSNWTNDELWRGVHQACDDVWGRHDAEAGDSGNVLHDGEIQPIEDYSKWRKVAPQHAEAGDNAEDQESCCTQCPGPIRYLCTKPIGHDGDHVATRNEGVVIVSWSGDSTADETVAPVPYDKHETAMTEVMEERDRAIEWADRLAAALAPAEVVGEHSNRNDPWVNALEWAEGKDAARPASSVRDTAETAAPRMWRKGDPANERVEWNPAGDTWLPATVVNDWGDDLLILLDENQQHMQVGRKHCRALGDSEPQAAIREMAKRATDHEIEKEKQR